MNDKVKTEFYNINYNKERVLSKAEKVRMDWISANVGKNKTVLDIGCWDGLFTKQIADRGNNIIGIDISESALEIARGKGLDVLKCDIENKFPFENSKFDLVVAGEIIEHVFDTRKFLNEINRVLKRNGTLILTTPNIASLPRRIFLSLGKNPLIEYCSDDGNAGHIRYFVKKTLCELVETSGFKIDRFTSDVLNFNASGNFCSKSIAKLIPTIGRSLMIVAKKTMDER